LAVKEPPALPGPYRAGEEARFKRDVLRAWEALRDGWKYFCVESPGTADGFPDVVCLSEAGEYWLCEFKVSDERGVVHFQRTQPLFYKKNAGLRMAALAWDVPRQRAVYLDLRDIVAAKSLRYRLPAEDSEG
jgi:hypothetical protein